MILTSKLGDTVTFRIPLRWGNRAFEPGGDWHLVFTAKSDTSVIDELAEIQIELGSGIAEDGNRALVSILASHTEDLNPGILYWDIQAEDLDSDDIRTVASGSWLLRRDVTRGRRSTIGSDPYTYTDPNGSIYYDPDNEPYTQTI